jgi:hypothetical protein
MGPPAAAPPSSGISLSPPFILSFSLSPTGLVAVTTADGRLWVGSGGDKSALSANKKKSRKWQGLSEKDSLFLQVANGPIVSRYCGLYHQNYVRYEDGSFSSVFLPDGKTLLTSTLLGKLAQHSIFYDNEQKLQVKTSWSAEVKNVAKVNAITSTGKVFVVGGITKEGKGAVEVWGRPETEDPTQKLSQLTAW